METSPIRTIINYLRTDTGLEVTNSVKLLRYFVLYNIVVVDFYSINKYINKKIF